MSKTLIVLALCFNLLCAGSISKAQENSVEVTTTQENVIDPRIEQLAQKILQKVPEIKETIPFLGRKEQRIVAARQHAAAIVAASDKYADQWTAFAKEAGWQYFDARNDLPALIAALTYRESSFRSVIRNDDNSITTIIPARRMGEKKAYDSGVMQVRVPSQTGRECGIRGSAGIKRMLTDLMFAYDVGTCVLTNHLKAYVPMYSEAKMARFHKGQRPDSELKFFGIIGARKDTEEANRLRELIVIERYNWGDSNLYTNTIASSYARRVLSTYAFFRTI